jgi:hypothetical protein
VYPAVYAFFLGCDSFDNFYELGPEFIHRPELPDDMYTNVLFCETFYLTDRITGHTFKIILDSS